MYKKHYIKNRITPPTAITAPITSLIVSLSFKNITAGGIIKIGTIDIIVDATPVVVYFTDKSEKETPKNGPKNAPMLNRVIAFLFFTALKSFVQLRVTRKINANPITPVITLI